MKNRHLTAVFVALLIFGLTGSAEALPDNGDVAPDFTLPVVNGEGEVTLSDLRGKVVYLDFWATWCAPCRRAFPEIAALNEEYRERGVEVLAISLDRSSDKAAQYLEAQEAQFKGLFDNQGRVANAYGVRSIPSTVILDASGKVAYSTIGFSKDMLPKIKSTLEELIAQAESKKSAETEKKTDPKSSS